MDEWLGPQQDGPVGNDVEGLGDQGVRAMCGPRFGTTWKLQ